MWIAVVLNHRKNGLSLALPTLSSHLSEWPRTSASNVSMRLRALARFESGLTIAAKAPSSVVLSGRKAEDEARLGESRAQLALGRAPEAKANLTKLASSGAHRAARDR